MVEMTPLNRRKQRKVNYMAQEETPPTKDAISLNPLESSASKKTMP